MHLLPMRYVYDSNSRVYYRLTLGSRVLRLSMMAIVCLRLSHNRFPFIEVSDAVQQLDGPPSWVTTAVEAPQTAAQAVCIQLCPSPTAVLVLLREKVVVWSLRGVADICVAFVCVGMKMLHAGMGQEMEWLEAPCYVHARHKEDTRGHIAKGSCHQCRRGSGGLLHASAVVKLFIHSVCASCAILSGHRERSEQPTQLIAEKGSRLASLRR
eukprot:764452-Amphidinium_carterae.1